MKMVLAYVFFCAVMVLTQAAVLPEGRIGSDPTAKSHLVKRSSDCPGGWSQLSGRCFLYIPRSMSWARAERNCWSMGANLASIHNIREYHEIQKLILAASHDYKETWIGGTDAQEENVWLWSDGSPFQYSNWCPGEPNNHEQNQHCLQMNFGGTKCWDDVECQKHRPSVCARKM